MGNDEDHIADILRHANEARDYVGSSTKEQFRLNGKERDSVNYKFVVIGEAANRLGPAFHKKHPTMPWSEIIGMRNIVAHHYGRVDPDIVWDAVKTKLPILIEYLTPLVQGIGNDDLGGPAGTGSEGTGPKGCPPAPSQTKQKPAAKLQTPTRRPVPPKKPSGRGR